MARLYRSDFQWIGRENDVLVKVFSPSIGEFLVLNELQLRYDNRLPRRMFAYAALAGEKYKLPVYPVLINILKPNPEVDIPNYFESEVLGLKARQDYRVINLWEIDAKIVFSRPLPSLLPFVPILRDGNDRALVSEAVQLLRADQKLDELEPLLAFFASFVLSSQVVMQIMRWDMSVLMESPWYQEIEAKGQAKGQAIGKELGIKEGLKSGLLSAIEFALELKFGADGLAVFPEISPITEIEQLQIIRDSLRTVKTLEELRNIYQSFL